MLFDADDANEIIRVLGYQVPYERLYADQFQYKEFAETYIDRALAILPLLTSIDKQLIEMLPDSMAVEVGELKLNYRQHKQLLLSQATALLNELAGLVGLQVAYNKYSGAGANVCGGNVSYW
jgi:hypothetical protein